ncbi:MAG TPA: hypothetical protein VLU96_03690 [Gaiellaceae bacterium]|nr:hypothetical protein [Gaiellaceae bacterium]
MRFIGAAGNPAPSSFRAPRPLKASRPLLALSLVPLIAGVAGLIPELDGLVLGALIAGTAALRAGLDWWHLSSLRRRADLELLGAAVPRHADLVAWRSNELTSEDNRRLLAKALRGLVSDLEPGRLPGASPLNRPGVRPHTDLILALGTRIGELERPVSAQSILLVQNLLTDGFGPLYARDRVDELGPELRRSLQALGSRLPASDPAPTPAGAHVRLHVSRNGRR